MLTPFLAYLLAEIVHASGVVAVVVAGLVLSYAGPARDPRRLPHPGLRVLGPCPRSCSTVACSCWSGCSSAGWWTQHRRHDASRSAGVAVWPSPAVVIGTRLLWVHIAPYMHPGVDRRAVQRARRVGWRTSDRRGWAGFRGAVSLAAALAVPDGGRRRGLPGPRPHRVRHGDRHPADHPPAGHDAAPSWPVGSVARGHRAAAGAGAGSRPPAKRARRAAAGRGRHRRGGETCSGSGGVRGAAGVDRHGRGPGIRCRLGQRLRR